MWSRTTSCRLLPPGRRYGLSQKGLAGFRGPDDRHGGPSPTYASVSHRHGPGSEKPAVDVRVCEQRRQYEPASRPVDDEVTYRYAGMIDAASGLCECRWLTRSYAGTTVGTGRRGTSISLGERPVVD